MLDFAKGHGTLNDFVCFSDPDGALELTDQQPADTSINAWHAMVDQKVFLGEAMDFRIKVGERMLLARTHPSVRTPIGHPVWARIDPSKSVAMPVVRS